MAFDSHPRTLGFRAVAYERYDSDVIVADFTPKMTSCSYSTRVHGGCHQAQLSLRLPATQAVRYVNQEIPLFFAHLVITEGLEWRWEGRITAVTIGGQRGSTHLNLSASGYWASIRDEEIRESITYTGLRADEIMCELLRTFCPSVVIRNCVDVVPGVLESFEVFPQRYTQDVIVNDLARLGDENLGRYYATIQEGREFHYRRVDDAFHKWGLRLNESDRWSLGRSVRDSRGTVYPTSTPSATTTSRLWATTWPTRTVALELPDVDPGKQRAAAQARADELGRVRDSAGQFVLTDQHHPAPIAHNHLGSPRAAISAGDIMELSLGRVDLGEVIVGQTNYDLFTDQVTIVPDQTPLQTLAGR